MKNKNIKVLLSKLGLDIHNRGVLTVAKYLRDAGMEVIYIGNSTVEQIIEAAIQEDVDIIGVSSLGGAHIQLGSELASHAKKEGLVDSKALVIGGVIPDDDKLKLEKMGFDAIFTSVASREEIISKIKKIFKEKTV
ncbi:MAG: cobalamin-dependent protein [Actinobacteria bacterium]|nr:cobalamin-dependent protein [Actinomycetota bacterium]